PRAASILLPYTTLFRSLHGFPLRIDRGQAVLGGERDEARSLLERGGVGGHDERIGARGGHGGERALELIRPPELEKLEAHTEGRSEEHTSELQSPDHLV